MIKINLIKTCILIVIAVMILQSKVSADIIVPDIESAAIHLDLYTDLANLEYDDSPYPGRTNLGNIIVPYLNLNQGLFCLNLGASYKHVFMQYDKDASPERVYPYINAVFHPWKTDFIIGNFANLNSFPNIIYNEFLFFEERPISSGLKFDLHRESLNFISYIDWIKLDTEEHPEEFETGLLFDHAPSKWFYYKLYNHYHHRGGQLHKDTHPVRIEQDIATSPAIGFTIAGFYTEFAYYSSMFSQNFEPSIYGNAGSAEAGYKNKTFSLSYLAYYNDNYYHKDAFPFYTKRNNFLNRIRFDYNILKYKDIIDFVFTANLYGMDPPGIDMRMFAKINLDIIRYEKTKSPIAEKATGDKSE